MQIKHLCKKETKTWNEERPEMNTIFPIQTLHGVFTARYSERGLQSLDFPGRAPTASAEPSKQFAAWHRKTAAALKRVLQGRPTKDLPPLDLQEGTDFQRAVWRALQDIPTGQTLSYSAVAKVIGRPRAVRAVGSACGANPIPLLIPCHRVLASNGKLGGFSGGLDWKIRLLEMEGQRPRP